NTDKLAFGNGKIDVPQHGPPMIGHGHVMNFKGDSRHTWKYSNREFPTRTATLLGKALDDRIDVMANHTRVSALSRASRPQSVGVEFFLRHAQVVAGRSARFYQSLHGSGRDRRLNENSRNLALDKHFLNLLLVSQVDFFLG